MNDLNFDQIYLTHADGLGEMQLITRNDIEKERDKEQDKHLLLTNEAERFCVLVVHHGLLPSEAYTHAFCYENAEGDLIKPDAPAYQSRLLLREPEIKDRIEEIRREIREWGKTTVEEVEMNYRRIALDQEARHADRISATKALCELRGFNEAPVGAGGGGASHITINLPFTPNHLGVVQPGITIEHGE